MCICATWERFTTTASLLPVLWLWDPRVPAAILLMAPEEFPIHQVLGAVRAK